jgi:hypothetical protein
VHVAAGQAGQLQRHMLGHVTEVGAARHRSQEPARLPGRAVMFFEPGQHRSEPLREGREVCGFLAGQFVKLDPRQADGLGAEDVRPAQMTQVFQAHVTLPLVGG